VLRILSILLLVGLTGPVLAQDIRVDVNRTPLLEALASFTVETGVDVVFSRTVVQPYRATCRYTGTSAQDALVCLVTGLPFRVQQISSAQFVLILLVVDPFSDRTHILSGFVTDAWSGETLIGAHVQVPALGAGAITNEAGYFALPGVPTGRRRVVTSYVGYLSSDTLLVVDGNPIGVALTPSALEVDGVVIEAAPNVRADLDSTPGLVSLPTAQLRALPGTLGSDDVLESLRWLPGIERAGEASGGLMIRGAGPDQNLYLIDGVPIYHPWHAFSLVSTFQTGTFRDILLYRGAFPAEYGGRLSSVLDAEMRDGGRSDPQVTAGVNTLHARFLIESPISPRASFMLSGRRSYIDKIIGREHPVSDDAGRRDTLRTGYYFYDWSAKLSYRPDAKSSLSISYYTGRDVLDLRLPFDVSLDINSFLRPADLFFEVDQGWGNRLFSVRFQRLLSERLFLTTTLYESRYDARESTDIRPSQSAFVSSDYSVLVDDLGARLDLDWYASLTHQVRAGVQMVQRRFESELDAVITYTGSFSEPLSDREDAVSPELTAYIQDLWQPTPNLRILPGLRVSYFGGGQYIRASPRLNLQFVVHPQRLILRAGASTQVQYLQRIQDRLAYLYNLVSSRWVPASAGVPPSRSGQVTGGLEYRPTGGLTLTADVYLRRSRNVLLPDDEFRTRDGLLGPGIEVSTLLAQYDRGQERAGGVELGLDFRRASWRVVGSYSGSYTRNRPYSEADDVFRPARFDAPRNGSLVVQRAFGPWTAGVSTIWRSGYPVTVPEGRYAVSDRVSGQIVYVLYRPDVNNGRLPAYFRSDVHVGYRFSAWNADWKAELNLFNVFFRRNVIGQSFDPNAEQVTARDRLGLPFLPLFDIEMRIR